MEFHFRDHPSIFLFLISLVLLGASIALCVLYDWAIYAVVAIVIAGVAVLVLGFSMVYDLAGLGNKKKKQPKKDEEKKEEENEDDRK